MEPVLVVPDDHRHRRRQRGLTCRRVCREHVRARRREPDVACDARRGASPAEGRPRRTCRDDANVIDFACDDGLSCRQGDRTDLVHVACRRPRSGLICRAAQQCRNTARDRIQTDTRVACCETATDGPEIQIDIRDRAIDLRSDRDEVDCPAGDSARRRGDLLWRVVPINEPVDARSIPQFAADAASTL